MAPSPMTRRTSRIMSLRYEIQAAREAEAQQQMFHTMAVPNGAPPTGMGTAGARATGERRRVYALTTKVGARMSPHASRPPRTQQDPKS